MRCRGPGPGRLRPVQGWRPRAGSGRALEESGEEVPDGGAAVVEDVVAAAAGAVVDGEADGMDEVVDMGGDDAVPATVDQAHMAGAYGLHEAGGLRIVGGAPDPAGPDHQRGHLGAIGGL